ncbi:heterokaryon incompatibility protein-domain-containing protein [Xylariaceae sp. FL0016]|nr:heterokaryon incompatibility protein-domain-containing protein [Xylariaceae sp. FL0016]
MASNVNVELQKLQRGRFQLNTPTSIRLLTLHKGVSGSNIHMTLKVVDLAQRPKFVALSCEWGLPSSNDPTIYVNEQPVTIRRNLFNFLTHLRNRNRRGNKAIWTDAICIDQDESQLEKEGQLDLMGQIYGQAQLVRAWLGEHDDQSRANFGVEYGDHALFGGKHYGGALALAMLPTYPSIAGRKIYRHVRLRMDKAPIADWKAVLERSYFERTWIIQELLLANEITFYCGQDTMDQRFSHKALEYYEMAGLRFPSLGSTGRYQIRDIFEMVYDYEYTQCSKPEDKIKAVLSLEAVNGPRLGVESTDTMLQLPHPEDLGHARHLNAEAILELALTSQCSTALQRTLIKAFDEYGFLEPNRSYMITTTQDPQQIVNAYWSWRANPKKPSSSKSKSINFVTLHEPMPTTAPTPGRPSRSCAVGWLGLGDPPRLEQGLDLGRLRLGQRTPRRDLPGAGRGRALDRLGLPRRAPVVAAGPRCRYDPFATQQQVPTMKIR